MPLDYHRLSDPEIALKAMLEGKVDAEAKVDSFIDYALDEMKRSDTDKLGRSHKSVRLYVYRC